MTLAIASPRAGAPPADPLLARLAATLPLLAFAVSLVSPLAAYAIALLAIYANPQPSALRTLSWIAFAHAGAVIFASRDLVSGSADFPTYFDSFTGICQQSPLGDDGYTFGLEIGLPMFYEALRSLGGCHLSIAGLAYTQGAVVASFFLLTAIRVADEMALDDGKPIALLGLALLFSFFYVTQLSRQTLSSCFLLHAIWLSRTRSRVAFWVLLATVSHLTAPVLFLFAVAFRRYGRVAIAIALLGAVVFETVLLDLVIQWAVPAEIAVFDKLAYYSLLTDDTPSVSSDGTSIAILLLAAVPVLFSKRAPRAWKASAEMLLGFALVGAALTALPLAATRLLLPFASLLGGLFLMRGALSVSRPMALAVVAFGSVARVASLALAPTGIDHALWTQYDAISAVPGYFLAAYVGP